MVQGVPGAVGRPALPMVHRDLATKLLPTCGGPVLEVLLKGLPAEVLLGRLASLRAATALSCLSGTLGAGLAQALAGGGRLCIPQGLPWTELAAVAGPSGPLALLLLSRMPLRLARLLPTVASPSSGLLSAAQTCSL